MEKNFGPNSEQLPNAEFSINVAAEDRRRGRTSQGSTFSVLCDYMWTHDYGRSKLTGYRVDSQLSIPRWETNGSALQPSG